MGMGLELMNQNAHTVQVVFTMIFEYVPEPGRWNFTEEVPLFLDVGDCYVHERPAAQDSVFQYTSQPWASTTEGHMVIMGGHVHDGGERVVLSHNDREICEMVATYSNESDLEGMYPRDSPSSRHITDVSWCTDPGELKLGDSLSITAFYNTTRNRPLLKANGEVQDVMGISMVYVGKFDPLSPILGWYMYIHMTIGNTKTRFKLLTAIDTGKSIP
jgi:hypothetical protein